MLRVSTDFDIPPGRGRSLNNRMAPQNDAIPRSARPLPPDPVQSGALTLSETEQSHIYHEWTKAGKPHNLVCSECRKPGELLACETCCRSYHPECLPAIEAIEPDGDLYCLSCRDKHWDHQPPQFPGTSSSNVSRSTTPSGRASRRHSPSGHALDSRHGSPISSGTPISGLQSSSGHPSPGVNYQHSSVRDEKQQFAHYVKLVQARQILVQNGEFPPDQDYSPKLLHKLGDMILQLGAQQHLIQENQALREENTRLQNINRELRVYTNSRFPPLEPAHNFPMSNIHTPSGDTSGKSWDRIVMDLI